MAMSGEQLHAFDICLCRHALDSIREHLHDPEIATYIAEQLPASVLAYLQALGDDEEAPPLLLGDQELDELSWIFSSGPYQYDQPWIPYGPLYRRGLDCVTEVREALSREHSEHWAQTSARFADQLEGDRVYLGTGIQIIREWVAEARRLLRAMGRTDQLPAPEGAFPTPTYPKLPPIPSTPAMTEPAASPAGPSYPSDTIRGLNITLSQLTEALNKISAPAATQLPPPEALSKQDAAKFLGVPEKTIEYLIRVRKIQYVQLGSQRGRVIPVEALRKLLQDKTQLTAQEELRRRGRR